MEDLSAFSAKPRLRLLLDHFAKIKDTRQSWKVAYPLREVLFLVVCGTIASGDDYEDIVDWGEAHLSFLRGFAEFHFGIPCADWLRCVINRINPDLFMACFTSWVEECWPDKLDLVAIDGKTSRRTHNRKTGHKALHLVSAFATNSRLVLGQEAVFEKSNEITAIPALVERLDLDGALVSIDAMGCNPTIAQSILDAEADYLLAVKDNQPTLHADIESYFETAPPAEVEKVETVERTTAVSRSATIPSRRWSTGMPHSAPIRAHRVFPNSPPSPWSRAASSAATRSKPSGDPISLPARSRLRPSRKPPAATGRSKTSFARASTPPSASICRACAPATAPRTCRRPPLRPQSNTSSCRQTIHHTTP